MNRIGLIIKREYLTRVRKRSFIIATLMAPLGLLIYMLVIVGLTKYQGGETIKVAIFDEAKMVGNLPDEKGVRYIPSNGRTLEELKKDALDKKIDGVLSIPALTNLQTKAITVRYYSADKLAPEKSGKIEDRLSAKIRDFKIDSLHFNRQQLEGLETNVDIDPESLDGKDDSQSKYTAAIGLALGGIMAFIMFFMITMYGNMVMRSVMEEKTNRIVEVIMSSVRPFQLMLGKIIGVGGVGLTQVLVWIILGMGVSFLIPFLIGVDPQAMQPPGGPGMANQIDPAEAQDMVTRMMTELGRQNWPVLLGTFIIFFLGAYFIYASLFAAIGSAMGDDLGEGQALTLPVMIPIILAFYIVAMAGVRNPNSDLMVFASLFPLFSPIVMPFRMAFDPPVWQVILSLLLVIGSAFFFVWLSGRIYRVGILLYGKKVTLRELSKWIFYKG